MGFAVFEGDSLLNYGAKELRKKKNSKYGLEKGEKVILDLLARFSPQVLILGKLTHPVRKKSPILKKLAAYVKRSVRRGVKVYECDPKTARALILKGVKPTQLNAAKFISSLYPELSEYVPQKRRILWSWKDRYWMNVFEAMTLFFAYREKSRFKDKTV
ncbi:MAG TPA: hypothetical protein VHT73_06045 [Thermodesulfobacteriota bacterium]|nr:hypothetical protein [Thermodesulfobacteriota bacterium]